MFHTEIEGKKFIIITIYASVTSADERKNIFNTLQTKISAQATISHTVVFLGDYNMTENPTLDKSSNNKRKDPSVPQLLDLRQTLQIEDSWRQNNPQNRFYTYVSAQGDRSRIDRIYISRNARNKTIHTEIKPCVHSDHASVHLTLCLADVKTGKGCWSLSVTTLEDPDYCELITQFWGNWILQKNLSPSLAERWEEGKRQIQTISKDFSKRKTTGEKRLSASLQKRLRNATKKAESGDKQAELLRRHFTEELKSMESKSALIRIMRAKAQWVEQGERCTKYFLNLEKKRREDVTMYKLEKSDGTFVTDSPEILSEVENVYKNLYTADPTCPIAQHQMLNNIPRKLTNIQKSFCEGQLSPEELKASVKALNNDKSPGTDELPAEFYKKFWDVIGQDLTEVFNSCYKSQLLPASQR